MFPSLIRSGLLALVLVAVALSVTQTASAQSMAGSTTTAGIANPLVPDFKATVGLGLVGAELGFVLPAAFGMDQTWAYIVFPVVGAAGGALAGHFAIDQGVGSAELSVAMLTTGMVLLIPALVFTVSATAYDPSEDMSTVALSALDADQRAAHEAGPGMLRLSERGTYLRAPNLEARQNLSSREALRTGADQVTEYRVSVVSGRF